MKCEDDGRYILSPISGKGSKTSNHFHNTNEALEPSFRNWLNHYQEIGVDMAQIDTFARFTANRKWLMTSFQVEMYRLSRDDLEVAISVNVRDIPKIILWQ